VDDSKGAGATVVKSDDTAPAGSETGPAASGEHLRQLELAGPTTLPTAPDGHYDLGDEHARGGLGRIVRSRDRRLDRTVAIKQLIRGTPINRARFAREARITARLQHPGVVPIYEAGVWPSGQQFYAMRLVEGRPLSAAIDDAASLTERLALLSRVLVVAETMAYAHSRGVIHRDLKPSNVLVGEYGETVVIDWGIAKELGETDAELDAPAAVPSQDLTVVGQVMGTPWYMAPEQARGEPTDERSDVYALGAILYHVLAGAPPHAEAAKVVETVAAGTPPPPLAVRAPGVAPDLVAIVDKALAAAPQARYPSAAELAADLKRYLNGQLVSVHRYGLAALVSRWVARHRAAVAIAALAAIVLVVGGVISVRNIVSARDEARRNASALSAQRDALILTQAESALDRDPTASLAWLKQYPLDGAEWNRVRTIAADAVSRGVARHVLNQGEEAYGIAISADASVVVMSGTEHVRTWDLATGRPRATFNLPSPRLVAASSSGNLVVANRLYDHDVFLWTNGAPTARRLSGHTDNLQFLAFTSQDDIVSASDDGTARIWTSAGAHRATVPAAGRVYNRVALIEGAPPLIVTFSPDGHVLVTDTQTLTTREVGGVTGAPLAVAGRVGLVAVSTTTGIYLWALRSGEQRRLGDSAGTQALFLTDRAVVELRGDSSIAVTAIDQAAPSVLSTKLEEITSVAVAPSGPIAVGDAAGNVEIWRPSSAIATDYTATRLVGHSARVYDMRFSRDESLLASASYDYTARVWPVAPTNYDVLATKGGDLFQLAYLADGSVMATSRSGAVYRFSNGSSAPEVIGRHSKESYALAANAAGTTVVTGGWDGAVLAWEPAAGRHEVLRDAGGAVRSVALSSDGRRVAAVSNDELLLGDIAGPLVPLPGQRPPAGALAFSPDGALLTSAGDNRIRVWDVRTRRAVREFRDATRAVFTRDGNAVVVAGVDGEVRSWSLVNATSVLVSRHEGTVRALTASAGGRWIASGGRDGAVYLWDGRSGRSILLGRHAAEVRDVAFSPDDKHLATASYDHSVRIWDIDSASSVAIRGRDAFQRVTFRADGRQLAATCADGSLYRVPVPLPDAAPTAPASLRSWFVSKTTDAR
jgi:WD40 repeat protein/tRNA A-37 threonylcarbamoyl transferase component Bud32